MRVFTIFSFRWETSDDSRSVLEKRDPEWRGSLLLGPAGDKGEIGA